TWEIRLTLASIVVRIKKKRPKAGDFLCRLHIHPRPESGFFRTKRKLPHRLSIRCQRARSVRVEPKTSGERKIDSAFGGNETIAASVEELRINGVSVKI